MKAGLDASMEYFASGATESDEDPLKVPCVPGRGARCRVVLCGGDGLIESMSVVCQPSPRDRWSPFRFSRGVLSN